MYFRFPSNVCYQSDSCKMIQSEKAYNEHTKSETKQRRPVNRGVWGIFVLVNTSVNYFKIKLRFRRDLVPIPNAIIATQALPHCGEEINLESQYVTLAAFIKNCIIPAGLWP